MNTNKIKLEELKEHLDTLIRSYQETTSSSLRRMENFNISDEDFLKESQNFNVAAFTLGYLNKVKEVAQQSDFKTAEMYIRFHKYQMETKSMPREQSYLKDAQKSTISVLSGIIGRYLDK